MPRAVIGALALMAAIALPAATWAQDRSPPATGLDGSYDAENPFARILRGEGSRAPVLETDALIAIIPLSQASRGHVLVIPKCECRTLSEVPAEQLSAVMTTLQRLMAAERLAYHPDGFNVRQNNGAAAGQTVFHVHFHLIPRYVGEPLQSDETVTLSPDEMDRAAAEIRTALAELP